MSVILSIAGPAIALVAIFVSIFLFRRGRQRRGLTYELSTVPVVSVDSVAADRVTVLYEGNPVRDVQFVDLAIVASGNQPIPEDSFAQPISMNFGAEALVLTATVTDRQPADLSVAISAEGSTIRVDPLLLNPGDQFRLRALVSNPGETRLAGRIEGISNFANRTKAKRRSTIKRFLVDSPASPLAAGVVAIVVALSALGASIWTSDSADHNDLVVLRDTSRTPLCGTVTNVDKNTIVVKDKDIGYLQAVPLSDVKVIKRGGC